MACRFLTRDKMLEALGYDVAGSSAKARSTQADRWAKRHGLRRFQINARGDWGYFPDEVAAVVKKMMKTSYQAAA